MNDLRKEIERQFKAHGLTEDKEKARNETSDNSLKETTKEISPVFENEEKIIPELFAPAGYQKKFAEDFKNLPQEWQTFLIEHENQNNKKYQQALDDLKDYKLFETQYEEEQSRLQEQGVNKLCEWLNGLIWIDKEMSRRPEQTLKAVAKVYGIKTDSKEFKQSNASEETTVRLNSLEKSFDELTSYIKQLQIQRLKDTLQMFGRQTDHEGNLLHPHFEAVENQVWELLIRGAAQNVDDAYEKALWLNPKVRSELIDRQISLRAAEAQKAQKAAFAPKGKTEAPKKTLTLREELEKNMAAFMD